METIRNLTGVSSIDTVLILPMRNGNMSFVILCRNMLIVLILPMRNGNEGEEKDFEKEMSVLILPMRNGNFEIYSIQHF